MNAFHKSHTGVAVLRPWPFGPPLRGRAPQHDAGTQIAPGTGNPLGLTGSSTAAPTGGRASSRTTTLAR